MKLGLLSAFFLLLTFNSIAASLDLIMVQGKCEKKVIPDRAAITFTAENTNKDQKKAFVKTTQEIEDLKSKLKTLNLKDNALKTTGYQVSPVREYEKDKVVDKGMRVALSLRVETSEIEKIGDTLAMASQLGISQVGNLETFLSLEKNRSEYLSCLDVAAEDAEVKALRLAKKLKFKIGDVHKIIESPQKQSTPVFHNSTMMKSMSAESMTTPKIDAGEQDFTATVDIHYKIK
jgi:uncharacterized protein YggE